MRVDRKQMERSIQAAKHAAEESFAKTGRWEPVAFIDARLGPDGRDYGRPMIIALPLPWIADGDRDFAMRVIHEVVRKVKAAQVVLVVEGWILSTSTDGMSPTEAKHEAEQIQREAQALGGVRNHPKKSEGIIVTAVDESNTGVAWIAPIDRSNGTVKLGEWRDGGQLGGYFSNLFPAEARA